VLAPGTGARTDPASQVQSGGSLGYQGPTPVNTIGGHDQPGPSPARAVFMAPPAGPSAVGRSEPTQEDPADTWCTLSQEARTRQKAWLTLRRLPQRNRHSPQRPSHPPRSRPLALIVPLPVCSLTTSAATTLMGWRPRHGRLAWLAERPCEPVTNMKPGGQTCRFDEDASQAILPSGSWPSVSRSIAESPRWGCATACPQGECWETGFARSNA